MHGLLADLAAPIDVPNMLSTIGSIGFAVWYAWHTTTKTIPDMQNSHKAERLEAHVRFDAAMQLLLEELKAEREQHADELKELRIQFSSDLRSALGKA